MATLWPRGADVGWIVAKLFVDPEHRGIGRALLAEIEKEARAWGWRAIGSSAQYSKIDAGPW